MVCILFVHLADLADRGPTDDELLLQARRDHLNQVQPVLRILLEGVDDLFRDQLRENIRERRGVDIFLQVLGDNSSFPEAAERNVSPRHFLIVDSRQHQLGEFIRGGVAAFFGVGSVEFSINGFPSISNFKTIHWSFLL